MNKKIYAAIENLIDGGIDIYHDAREKARKVGTWVIENPQATVSIVSSIALLLRASQSLVVSHRLHSEHRRVDYTYYDRRSGHRWQLRRKLTNGDRAVIDRRKNRGDDMYDILADLGVI